MSSSQQQPSEQDLKDAHKLLFDSGLRTRYAVAGKEYVDKSLANGSSEFSRPMQGETSHPSFPLSFSIQIKPTQPITNPSLTHQPPEYVTESCWHSIWGRPGLEKKTRSLLNIAMLCALNRSTELAVHVRGAVNNGATEVEIRETVLQVACYCGMPAGIEGTKVAERVILEMKKELEEAGKGEEKA